MLSMSYVTQRWRRKRWFLPYDGTWPIIVKAFQKHDSIFLTCKFVISKTLNVPKTIYHDNPIFNVSK